ncbi:MAG: chemotaxis protein CheX [Deltaproteobacteria bacterium]|nr:chemotaxis protein CheX [Deltaproteobacteria bacterium]
MDVRFINPFLLGTVEVLKTMAFIEPRAGKPFLNQDSVATGDVSGVIGITGVVKGSIALSFSETCILKIVSNMLGEESQGIDGNVKDAVGELTNMVSGTARRHLEREGFSLKAAIPTVIAGKNHSITHVLGGPSIIIPFETDFGPFVVDVCLGK